jgi:hypothetical protein
MENLCRLSLFWALLDNLKENFLNYWASKFNPEHNLTYISSYQLNKWLITDHTITQLSTKFYDDNRKQMMLHDQRRIDWKNCGMIEDEGMEINSQPTEIEYEIYKKFLFL